MSSGIGKEVVTFRMGPDAAAWACGNKNKTGNGKNNLEIKFVAKIHIHHKI